MYSDGSFCCSNRTQFCLPARARFLRSVLYRSRRRCAHFHLDTERRGNHCTRRPCHMILLLKCLMYGSRTSNMRDIKFLHGTCFWSPAMLKQFRLHSFHFFPPQRHMYLWFQFIFQWVKEGSFRYEYNFYSSPSRFLVERKKRFYLHNISRLDLYLSRKLYVCSLLSWLTGVCRAEATTGEKFPSQFMYHRVCIYMQIFFCVWRRFPI